MRTTISPDLRGNPENCVPQANLPKDASTALIAPGSSIVIHWINSDSPYPTNRGSASIFPHPTNRGSSSSYAEESDIPMGQLINAPTANRDPGLQVAKTAKILVESKKRRTFEEVGHTSFFSQNKLGQLGQLG